VLLIKHSSLENLKVMLYLFKCMLMILSLAQLITLCMKSLLQLSKVNLKCI